MTIVFPKILFIGAVTFEEISGSHAFFYRLFKKYPADRLMVIGSHKSRNSSFPSKQLPGVNYVILENFFEDTGNITNKSIAFPYFRSYYHRVVKEYFRSYSVIKQAAKSFNPDIILTLSMDYHWFLAYKLSCKLNIPLELVLHDQWEANTTNILKIFLNKKFKGVFRHARRRFCISPSMEKFYYDKFKLHSDILYPLSGTNKAHPSLRDPHGQHLNLVFFGNIWGNLTSLINLAHLLDHRKSKLIIFSNRKIEYFYKHGLKTPNVETKDFYEDHESLLDWCQKNADILYLPIHFEETYAEEIICSFPSKLADYCALGLPIIIHAPKNSSINNFVIENSDYKFAEVVNSTSKRELLSALDRLREPEHRKNLGKNSLYIWQKFFDPEIGRQFFLKRLFIETSSIKH